MITPWRPRSALCRIALYAAALVVIWQACGAHAAPPAASKRPLDASDEFFDRGAIPHLKIELTAEAAQALRQNARAYVKCRLIENGQAIYPDVAIKLKGAAGSFRGLDDRPALTLNVDKHVKKQTFHALTKFHLNNSVQDDSYLCEWICTDLCRDAGVPATRVTHARVWLNDRDLGLYVLKEGFDTPFLKRHFGSAKGNLYDGGFCADINADLEKDSGKGPDDRSDLKALAAACQEPDAAKRWPAVEAKLDVPAMQSLMAIELMTCHWDGYAGKANNYRVYFHPRDGKAHFLPHGMDQMFQDAGFPILHVPPPIAARAVMENPAWRRAYRKRVEELLPLFAADRLAARIDEVQGRLQPVAMKINEGFARAQAQRAADLKNRIAARERNLREQLLRAEPLPLEFNAQGTAEIRDWTAMQESADARLEAMEADGKKVYSIAAGAAGNCVASWRRKVLLAQGHYRLEARLKGEAIEPRRDDIGTGAGLRISGGRRENQLVGDRDWQSVAYEFEVAEAMREVVLVVELRATRGRLWMEDAARLIHVEQQALKR